MKIERHPSLSLSFLILALMSALTVLGQSPIKKKQSVYLFPKFQEGTIINESGKKIPAMLNYNMVEGKMYVSKNGIRLKLSNKTAADTILIADRTFIAKNDVYYEVLLSLPTVLYREHRQKMIESGVEVGYGVTSKTTGSNSISFTAHDNDEVPEGKHLSEYSHYHILINEKLEPFRSFAQYQKFFPEQKKEIKTYIKQQKLDFEVEKDMIRLVVYTYELL